MRAATRLPAAFFQRVVEICFRRLQRRRETKDDAAHEGEREREEQHGSVDAELIPAGCKLRRLAGVAGAQSVDAPETDQPSKGAANEGHYHAFSQQLPHDSPATRTQRRSQSDLFLASTRARKHQVRSEE